jgi:hypothetical protein
MWDQTPLHVLHFEDGLGVRFLRSFIISSTLRIVFLALVMFV